MSRRRESRKHHRAERRRRPPGESAPVAAAAPARAARRDISLSGLTGALAGALTMGAVGVAGLIDPGETARWWAVVFLVLALGFVPAAWASVAATPHRRRVYRVTTVGCLAAVGAGVLGFGLGFAALLALPTTLLATAAGYVFQGGVRKR